MRGSINLYKARDIEAKRKELARAMRKKGKVALGSASVSGTVLYETAAGAGGGRSAECLTNIWRLSI